MNPVEHEGRIRRGFLFVAAALVLVALLPPVNTLANGVLFSAHMAQHLLLLLVVPALAWMAIAPAVDAWHGRPSALPTPPGRTSASARRTSHNWRILVGWGAGVGAMWFWHAPALCDAAATNPEFHAVQVITLLACGAAFWRPILGAAADRLNPGFAVAYLFGACLACSALGILLTLTPLEVCSVFRGPVGVSDKWLAWRNFVGPDRDRQIGGLLMWVPMCLAYLGAIVWELGRWLGATAGPQEEQS